jgi:hypothetical protein
MTKWEYKYELRHRDVVKKQWDNDIASKLNDLGAEGWELVAISPRSGEMNSANQGTNHYSTAGFTTEELWVFKRQVE